MEYTNDFISDVSEFVFKVGDKVITPYSECEVWKVTDKSVHVKHWDEKRGMWMFSKYLTDLGIILKIMYRFFDIAANGGCMV